MSQEKERKCETCVNGTPGFCRIGMALECRLDGAYSSWVKRADAPTARQEPAGAPNGTAAIPAQPDPIPNANPAAWSMVIQDMAARDVLGLKRYGVRLQPGNGRDTLRDAYEEALDLAVYLRTAIYERDGK